MTSSFVTARGSRKALSSRLRSEPEGHAELRGIMTKVIYYTTENGDNPVSDFLDKLEQAQQAKLLRIVSHIKMYGLQSVLPHVRKLTGVPLWEIRILGKDNIRVIYKVDPIVKTVNRLTLGYIFLLSEIDFSRRLVIM